MHIYGSPLSPFVARIILACKHKGLGYTIAMPEGGLKTPEYLALNPFGKIPTVKDGSTVLFESGVILPYLDDKYPKKKKVIPASPAAAGNAGLIARVCDLYVQEPALDLFRQVVGRAPKDKAAAKKALADMEAALDILNGYISPGPCATGKSFTIADCYVIPALLFATAVGPLFGLKDPLKGRPNVKKYWAAIKKHPAAKAHMTETQKIMKDRLKSL
ncbi:MAG: glutathione S-transferase family protein [Rhodospirillaceae bacterium]|jgi:glutathione S-transferase|nr:glutathione S-transferase family protein [Rhodospirillaceae bacterium]MBT5240605.1 glutathione S-transferase family protein [Rhodospirillaceae bacterium]MBT5564439.1 glutathione S-transferase family protein [Rhodospirillaceae bacterium]MBT6089730.1 glutathione S-transferase family protein [Rhodospirillaceae bacterium]